MWRNIGTRCYVPGCTKSSGLNPEFTFHRPRDRDTKTKWEAAIASRHPGVKKGLNVPHICSSHFADDAYVETDILQFRLGLAPKRRRLKHDAVPTLFQEQSLDMPCDEITSDSIRIKEEASSCSSSSPSSRENHGNAEDLMTRVCTEAMMAASVSISVKIEPEHTRSSIFLESQGNAEDYITGDYPHDSTHVKEEPRDTTFPFSMGSQGNGDGSTTDNYPAATTIGSVLTSIKKEPQDTRFSPPPGNNGNTETESVTESRTLASDSVAIKEETQDSSPSSLPASHGNIEGPSTEYNLETTMVPSDFFCVKEEPRSASSSPVPGNDENMGELLADEYPETTMVPSDFFRVKEEPRSASSSPVPGNDENMEELLADDYPAMDTSPFYGLRQHYNSMRVRPVGGDDGDSDDSCLSDSDDEDFVPEKSSQNANNITDHESAEEDDETDTPVTVQHPTREGKIQWKSVRGPFTGRDVPEWGGNARQPEDVREPVDYFRQFFHPHLLQKIVTESNSYAIQQNTNRALNLERDQLEQFLGIVIYMSVIVLPRSRHYWSQGFSIPQVCQTMSRDRWEEIKQCLHFNNNASMPPSSDPTRDRLYKVRPLVDSLVHSFNQIPMDQTLCVDEQLVPFEGRSSLKQYLPKKTPKWEYKLFVLSGSDGIIRNLEVYAGRIDPLPGYPDLGESANVVLRLACTVPARRNHLLYFDRRFTSLPLQAELAKREIYCLGTVRADRLKGCRLMDNKAMKTAGRGTFDEKEGTQDGVSFRAVKWYDNGSVVLLSTFASAEPVAQVKRLDRQKKETIEVPCPSIVLLYNKFMGGVHLLDGLIGLYRITVRSRKYYLRLFFHFIDLALVTSWLMYRRDSSAVGVPQKKQMALLSFRGSVAECLCKEGKGTATKKRPSATIQAEYEKKKKLGRASKPLPGKNVRTDNIGHWPIVRANRGRCKVPGCKGSPVTYCQKCCVHLCLDKKKNCFVHFHTDTQ